MGIRRFISRLRAQVGPRRPRPVILLYHRVAALRNDPWDLAVPPEVFLRQMAYLRRRRTPMAMEELVSRLQSQTLPSNAVAVTFDDGYRDNLVNAKPVLARYGVPAMIFVATGYIGREEPYWWDELATIVLESREPVNRFEVSVNGDKLTLSWGPPESGELDPSWRGWDEPQTARQRMFLQVWSRLQSVPEEERRMVLGTLRKLSNRAPDPLSLPMSSQETQEILADGLITFGAHTVTHPALTYLDRAETRQQIKDGREQCRELSGKEADGFAYPYGNYDEEVCNSVASVGFAWACTTEPKFLDGRPGIFALPRVAIPNGSMRRFHRLLTS